MSNRIVLIGAGSAQFGTGTLGDIFQSTILTGSEIILHDINSDALKKMLIKTEQFIQKHSLDFSVSATLDRKEALTGANFVIISIEVGDRFALWDMDRTIPQQYGIHQVYGENGGPGGLFHSLRIIPPILDICSDISDICPDAFIFNYSNPMSRIVTTVKRKFPHLKFTGLCHEIASLQEHLPVLLNTHLDNIVYRAGGLNHFSVLLEARYKDTGRDAYRDILRNANSYFSVQPGYSEMWKFVRETFDDLFPFKPGASLSMEKFIPKLKQVLKDLIPSNMGEQEILSVLNTEGFYGFSLKSHLKPLKEWSDRFLFGEILKTFHLLPITGDSHFGEYIQWAHTSVDQKGIIDFYVFYRTMLSLFIPEISLNLEERVVPIIEGIITDSGYEESAVNILNDGFIEDLPPWLAVEVPAIIDAGGIHGIKVDVPAGFRGLLANQIGIHNMTAETILRGSRNMVLQTLLVDPIVDTSAGLKDMVDYMIEMQAPYLQYLK